MRIILALLFLVSSLSLNAQSYIIEQPLTGLTYPTDFAFIPGTSKVIVLLKQSSARIYDLSTNSEVSVFWTFTDSLNYNFERGVLGVAVDPNFNTNRYIYIYYVHSNPANSNTNQRIRIVRFTENNNLGTNPFLVVDHFIAYSPAGNHFGGIIKFKPTDPNRIYYVTGELATSNNAQLLNNPYGKILRINKDGTIPTDNPFYDDGNPLTGNDDRIWVYGIRNSFGFCFSPFNDSLYESENGANSWDEVNFIRKGRNYGWPVCEGYCNPYNPTYTQPMHVWGQGNLPALTGALIYNGTQMPWLNGKLLIADNDNGYIYSLTLNNTLDSVVSRTQILDLLGLTTLLQGTDGYIYALRGGYTTAGLIYRIKPDPTGIDPNGIPVNFRLDQNYPNPFNPSTSIKYSLIKEGFTTIKIFDVTGNEVSTLVSGNVNAGEHETIWDAAGFASGVYFYRMTVNGQSIEKKMVLVK